MLRVFREAAILCALAAVPAAVTGYRELKFEPAAPLAQGEVKFADAWAWGEKAIWVDARTKAKFEHKKIPTAIALNPDDWEAQVTKFLDEWDPEKKVIVYGDRTGDSAQTVALRLKEELKIPEVYTLYGGFESYQQK